MFPVTIQDPTNPRTRYLLEAIVSQLSAGSVTSWQAMFAFAGTSGVRALLGDPVVVEYFRDQSAHLVVGIDAVTSKAALESLLEYEAEYDGLRVSVFKNPVRHLFHPKAMRFDHGDRQSSFLVGSGNLTEGGLVKHFEAFSMFALEGPARTSAITEWDGFFTRQARYLVPIDDAALEKAESNTAWGGRRTRTPVPEVVAEVAAEGGLIDAPPEGRREDLVGDEVVFVGEIPDASGRWQQAHFSKAAVDRVFGVDVEDDEQLRNLRIFLHHVQADGTRDELETRPVVFSSSNANTKIELGALRGRDYPANGRPILIALSTGLRAFDYVVVFPDSPNYGLAEAALAAGAPIEGNRGLRRVTLTSAEFRALWPGSPLVNVRADVGDPF